MNRPKNQTWFNKNMIVTGIIMVEMRHGSKPVRIVERRTGHVGM